jgi:hypothetical protein
VYLSDRWITPGVIVTLILTAGGIVLGIAGGLVYLSSIGRDPDPVLRFVVEVTGTLAILVNVLLSLASRASVAKTERNTGLIPERVAEAVEDRLATYGDHAAAYPPPTVAAPRTAPPPVPAR